MISVKVLSNNLCMVGFIVLLLMKTNRIRFDCLTASSCIKATISEESIPPERKAPTGTSAIICKSIASINFFSRAKAASLSLPSKDLFLFFSTT